MSTIFFKPFEQNLNYFQSSLHKVSYLKLREKWKRVFLPLRDPSNGLILRKKWKTDEASIKNIFRLPSWGCGFEGSSRRSAWEHDIVGSSVSSFIRALDTHSVLISFERWGRMTVPTGCHGAAAVIDAKELTEDKRRWVVFVLCREFDRRTERRAACGQAWRAKAAAAGCRCLGGIRVGWGGGSKTAAGQVLQHLMMIVFILLSLWHPHTLFPKHASLFTRSAALTRGTRCSKRLLFLRLHHSVEKLNGWTNGGENREDFLIIMFF